MTAHIGQCGLCLKTKALQNSHLMPKSLYKRLRRAARDLIIVMRSGSFATSKQVSSPFLCRDCEQRFHEHGEDYFMSQCLQLNGQFKLHELLQAASPLYSRPQGKVYDVQPLLGNKMEQYLYFAASIFWRASAHRWKADKEWLDPISFGPTYQEQLRLYLLNEAAFPPDARVWVFVINEAFHPDMIYFPSPRIGGVGQYDFFIAGIHFALIFSELAPQEFDRGALNGRERPMMWLCPWMDDSVFIGARELVISSTPSEKLRRRAIDPQDEGND
jgi:hypothetical protein